MISADLGQQLEGFVAQLVSAGRYNSKSEVLREGVRLVQDREARLAALDASVGLKPNIAAWLKTPNDRRVHGRSRTRP